MIKVQNTLLSRDLFDKMFACDLNACKGACCIEGDSGAPLEPEEVELLENAYPVVKPYLREESRQVIAEKGVWEIDEEGDTGTTLLNGQECSFVVFEKGTAFCGIEKAWLDGKTDFRKPISCQLYPIRVNKLEALEMEALNYDRWSICNAACHRGEALKLPIFRFLKEPLIRKYGEAYFEELEEVYEAMSDQF